MSLYSSAVMGTVVPKASAAANQHGGGDARRPVTLIRLNELAEPSPVLAMAWADLSGKLWGALAICTSCCSCDHRLVQSICI